MTLEIQFSNSNAKFSAGDSVSGNVIIKNKDTIEVTGLKITMFIQCRIVTSVNPNGKANTTDREKAVMVENLNSKVFNRRGDKLKLLPPGSHTIPFKFSSFPTKYPHSFEGEKIMCRYFVKADLETISKEILTVEKKFKIGVLPLEENPDAQGWQVKSNMKILKTFPLRKIGIKVTLPTGIDRRESVPILISISNNTNHPVTKIQSRLICTLRLPKDINKKEVKFIANQNSEENINIFNGNLIHHLKIHTGFSFDCPLITEKFRVQLRMETSDGAFLEVEMPVVVGIRRSGAGRMDRNSMEIERERGAQSIMKRFWGAPPSYEEAMQTSRSCLH